MVDKLREWWYNRIKAVSAGRSVPRAHLGASESVRVVEPFCGIPWRFDAAQLPVTVPLGMRSGFVFCYHRFAILVPAAVKLFLLVRAHIADIALATIDVEYHSRDR